MSILSNLRELKSIRTEHTDVIKRNKLEHKAMMKELRDEPADEPINLLDYVMRVIESYYANFLLMAHPQSNYFELLNDNYISDREWRAENDRADVALAERLAISEVIWQSSRPALEKIAEEHNIKQTHVDLITDSVLRLDRIPSDYEKGKDLIFDGVANYELTKKSFEKSRTINYIKNNSNEIYLA